MKLISRQNYLDKIERYLGKDTIIILTGQRRVGKSFVLRLFKDKVSANPDNNLIYINKERYKVVIERRILTFIGDNGIGILSYT